MPEVYVNLDADSYKIQIEQGVLTELGSYMRALRLGRNVLVITNPAINQCYGDIVQASLTTAGFTTWVEEIPAGEETKSFVSAMQLYDRAIRLGMDRKSPIIALGGGVVGDLSGFIAATYMRGVPFIQVPTTLLAQVDSSVGGKVAVNHPLGKNLIGAFYQPKLVLIDPDTLTTLPDREWLSGFAEVIKYGVIQDAGFFDLLAGKSFANLRADVNIMTKIIQRACEIKAQVVSTDEKETGLRIILNYGHTIGHALESASNYQRYTHGEAIAIGMAGAARLANLIGWLSDGECQKIATVIASYGLPIRYAAINQAVIEERLYHDKKKEGSSIRWVLPRSIGTVDTTTDMPVELIRQVLAELSS